MVSFTTEDVLTLSDPAHVHFRSFIETINERLAPHSITIVDVFSTSTHDSEQYHRPFPLDALSSSALSEAAESPSDVLVLRNGLTTIRLSFNNLDRIAEHLACNTIFVVRSPKGPPPPELAAILKRLYHHSLIQERTRLRRKTIDSYLKTGTAVAFWPHFIRHLRDIIPFRSAQIISHETLSSSIHILHPVYLFNRADGLRYNVLDITPPQTAGREIDNLVQYGRPKTYLASSDPILPDYFHTQDGQADFVVYSPLIAQRRRHSTNSTEIRVGGAIRIVDPLVRQQIPITRPLTWEDEFILAFASEVCAVLMNNAFVGHAQVAAVQRISHGFTAALNAMTSSTLDVEAALVTVGRVLLPYSTTEFLAAKQCVARAADYNASISAWAEEMWQQVLFESKMYDIADTKNEEVRRADVKVMPYFAKEVVGRVYRTVKSLREKYKRPWVNLPNHFEILNHMPRIQADAVLLRAVFRNLLENSIKYHDVRQPEISIGISYRLDKEFVYVAHSDNGIGLRAAELVRLFEAGYRSDRAIACKVEGKGLGLFQAKIFLEHMGGNIWAEKSDVGAKFVVKLKRA